uniref:Uncharacterized protein n=1 Tax=Arundo donax TaxID=35708 RepID=A0A0A9AFJ8_ARUDO
MIIGLCTCLVNLFGYVRCSAASGFIFIFANWCISESCYCWFQKVTAVFLVHFGQSCMP